MKNHSSRTPAGLAAGVPNRIAAKDENGIEVFTPCNSYDAIVATWEPRPASPCHYCRQDQRHTYLQHWMEVDRAARGPQVLPEGQR